MRTIVAWALGAIVLLGVSTAVEAKKSAKKPKQYAARHVQAARGPADGSQWYPHDTSKLPFGSSVWWDQMLREGRLTCCN